MQQISRQGTRKRCWDKANRSVVVVGHAKVCINDTRQNPVLLADTLRALMEPSPPGNTMRHHHYNLLRFRHRLENYQKVYFHAYFYVAFH